MKFKYISSFLPLYLTVWSLLHTHCRCRGLLLHLIILIGTTYTQTHTHTHTNTHTHTHAQTYTDTNAHTHTHTHTHSNTHTTHTLGLLWTKDRNVANLTKHKIYKTEIFMPSVEFEPAIPAIVRPQTHSSVGRRTEREWDRWDKRIALEKLKIHQIFSLKP